MKELLRFSLRRRFSNKATIAFNLIIFVVIAGACFSDKIMNIVDPSIMEKECVYVKGGEEDLLAYLNEIGNKDYVFKGINGKEKEKIEEGYKVLEVNEKEYLLHSKYKLSIQDMATYNMFINNYHKALLMADSENKEVLDKYNHTIEIKNKVIEKELSLSQEKSNLIFIFVTSIYFMMLSFVSGVASEVVNEKATKTLELILTSVNAKTHFYSKLLVGWFVIVMQGLLTLSYILFWLLVRSIYDQGVGLIAFVNKIGLMNLKEKNFYGLLFKFDFTKEFFMTIFWVILFLLLGILLIQLVLVIVSSFVSSIEEAGNIQAPFHLLLLGFYYLTLAINNPHDLNEGIGYYLSFVPFLNMLLMPCRLLIQNVPNIELLLSVGFSLVSILFIVKHGSKIYEKGVLDYSCKGFIDVIKKIKIKNN